MESKEQWSLLAIENNHTDNTERDMIGDPHYLSLPVGIIALSTGAAIAMATNVAAKAKSCL